MQGVGTMKNWSHLPISGIFGLKSAQTIQNFREPWWNRGLASWLVYDFETPGPCALLSGPQPGSGCAPGGTGTQCRGRAPAAAGVAEVRGSVGAAGLAPQEAEVAEDFADGSP